MVDHLAHATGGPFGGSGGGGPLRRGTAALPSVAVTVATGLRGEAEMVVGDGDTARALRSGTVDVLGTPRLIALCEEASCRAIAPVLADGTTTVGMKVGLDHLQPSGIGERVVAEAVLSKVEGRRLTFTVSAFDSRGLVAAGKVLRVVVDVERFMGKCGTTVS
jgi:fluoroacetyl-CoA thioesterase